VPSESIAELAKEYQDYVLAHRIRSLIGGRLKPGVLLSIASYAKKRLERQKIAREIVTIKPLTMERMQRVDQLTNELCFGLWRTPFGMTDFLHNAWKMGGHLVLEHPEAFVALLLLPSERQRLPEHGLEVARYYHACLRLSAAAVNPNELEMVLQRVELQAAKVPLFLDIFATDENMGQP
jgi:hypothetical protein